MKLINLSFRDVVYVLTLLATVATAWGSLSAKVVALEVRTTDVGQVAQRLTVVETKLDAIKEGVEEVKRELRRRR